MTGPSLHHTLALVALNGRAMELHREFTDAGLLELAALMRQIGEQTVIAMSMVVRKAAEVGL